MFIGDCVAWSEFSLKSSMSLTNVLHRNMQQKRTKIVATLQGTKMISRQLLQTALTCEHRTPWMRE